ncbi:unnamed protein product [Heligmosomoides polygyrus]|uniref:Uncharacterized protein n=1 Tax=Heligmosomoides polygyrus TaxID=6339 RepID=A0A183FG80_HELPZ|nr:unnamed protein product [Heligmosomoides polygyrus]
MRMRRGCNDQATPAIPQPTAGRIRLEDQQHIELPAARVQEAERWIMSWHATEASEAAPTSRLQSTELW